MYTKIILYPVYAVTSWVVTILSIVFSPLIALCVGADGNLPNWLHWFQTPDAPCWGAPFWKMKHPTYSTYRLCVTWLIRNPAQGFDQWANAGVAYNTPVKIYGDLSVNDQAGKGGWFFLAGGGVFQLSAVILIGSGRTLDVGVGWRLDPIAKGYNTATLGALLATPIRIHQIN